MSNEPPQNKRPHGDDEESDRDALMQHPVTKNFVADFMAECKGWIEKFQGRKPKGP